MKRAVAAGVAWLALMLAGHDRAPDALEAVSTPMAHEVESQDVSHRLPGT